MATNKKFADDESFPYPLLCDTDREICLAYGGCQSKDDGSSKRITCVIGADEKVVHLFRDVNAREHTQDVIDVLT
mgnify:FL=1